MRTMNEDREAVIGDAEALHAPKERPCLMCRLKFMSQWSGERICQKCKTRAIWREGVRWPSGIG